jgi:glucosamine--fructose-6-phosphate aminotransferase (isomerizing)
MVAQRPVGLAAPSIHTLYAATPKLGGYLAIAISQSGRTPEIVTVIERMRRYGARTLAVVNEPESPLAQVADAVIELGAGNERAVPATKTVTATMTALALVAGAMGQAPWSAADLAALPVLVAQLLADGGGAETIAASLACDDRLLVTGRGLMLSAALETALKVRETSGLLADGISPADLRHGPIAAVSEGFPVVGFSSGGADAADAADLAETLRRRGARVFTVRPGPGSDCTLPRETSEALLPILAVVRGQQIAAALGRRLGRDADAPEGLTKVTPTR